MNSLDLKYYKWKDIPGIDENNIHDRHKLGWIAQDVEGIFPKAVNTIDNAFGIDNVKSLNTDQIYAMMYGTVKKLMEKVERLERENRLIKQKLSTL